LLAGLRWTFFPFDNDRELINLVAVAAMLSFRSD
jgi:hypothetical protein